MMVWYNNDKHFWVVVAGLVFMILWYIPLYLKKRKMITILANAHKDLIGFEQRILDELVDINTGYEGF